MRLAIVLFLGGALRAETLNYSVNWASGLSLGEATLVSNQAKAGESGPAPWTFDLNLDVSVPGFALRDRYHASSTADFCSEVLEKHLARGNRKSEERVSFDQGKSTAKRVTTGGGSSELSVSKCARDPLALLQFLRRELAQGRLAPQQSVVFGSVYQVRFEYTGVQNLLAGSSRTEAERIQTTVKGPATDVTMEVFFARDAARTPILARLPLPLGTLTVELMR